MADEPRTWIVSQDGTGDFDRIQPALDAARPGDTVLAREGVYVEDLRLREGVTLRGEGTERTRLVAVLSNAIVAEHIAGAAVYDLSVDGADKEGMNAIWIVSARISIVGCAVSRGGLNGIEAKAGARLTLRANTVSNNKGAGVIIHEDGEGELEENTITENGYSGIEARERGRVRAIANTVSNNKGAGVFIYEDGEGELEENTITENGGSGIAVRERGRVIARANTVSKNKQTGVFIQKDGEGELEENTITENGVHGIEARERGRVKARTNTISNNKEVGVFIQKDGEGELEENTITENGYSGIEARERGRLKAQTNTFSRNAACGIWIYKEARATLRYNIIAYNKNWGGIKIIDQEGDPPSGEISLVRNCLWGNNPDYVGQMDTSHDMVADPRFVDAQGGDYHLLPDSPCIGAGLNGEDLGALPFKREMPPPLPPILPTDPLHIHLRSLPLAHIVPPTPARPAYWLRAAAAVGAHPPLCIIQDLGALLTQPRQRLSLARPAHLHAESDTAAYLAFLNRLAKHPLLCEVSGWDISEAVAGVALARLVAGISFPEAYALPAGDEAVGFARRLAFELEGADPALIWRETDRADRPDLARLLPPSAMSQIEANLRQLDADELRFLHRYGPRFSGAPDPRSLLDLFNLLQLPPAVRLAMAQVLKLLPRVSEATSVGGMQTYSLGGYGGITRKGNLDNLLLTELAYPEEMLLHRLLNQEALYYGREAERERRRELAYIVTQMGVEMKGDGEALARALTLALAQTMQRRGYEVLQSFVGSEWSPPEPMNRPVDVQRTLYYRDNGWLRVEEMLGRVAGQMREWGERYRGMQVLWVVGEHWDADDWEEHAELYGELRRRGGQQAWFVRVGSGNRGKRPVAAVGFERFEIVENSVIWDSQPAQRL